MLVKSLAIVLAIGGMLSLTSGLWLHVKAVLAQALLRTAWQDSRVTSQLIKPWPWADTWPVGKLIYEKMRVEQVILEGASGEALAFGPGHLSGSALPGEGGHCILQGHRDTSFSFLDKVGLGDQLLVEGKNGSRLFRVIRLEVVEAEHLYLDPDQQGALTLITCYPFDAIHPGTSRRYVVSALLME